MINSRQKRLLDILLKQKGSATAEYYSQVLGISKRSVYSYLDIVEPYLKEKGYSIKKIPSKGIEVVKVDEKTDKINQESVEDYSLTNRRNELLSRVIINNEKVMLGEFCDEFYVSEGAIRNDISYFKEMIKSFPQVDIIISRGEIYRESTSVFSTIKAIVYLIENETNSLTFEEKIDYYYRVFDPEIVDIVVKTIRDYLEQLNINIGEYYISHICTVMNTIVNCASNDEHVNKDEKLLVYDKIKNLPNILLATQFLEGIGKSLNITFSEGDIELLSDYLKADRIQISNFEKVDEKDLVIYREVFDKLEKTVDITIDEHDTLVQNLLLHLNAMVFRLRNGIVINNALTAQIKSEFGVLFNLMGIIFESVEEKLNIKITDDEIGFLLIHIQNIIEQQKKVKNILLVCPHGAVASNLALNRIKNLLPAYNFIEVLSVAEIKEVNLRSIDFIISTVDIAAVDKPVVKISPLLTKEDQLNVMKFYQELIFDQTNEKGLYENLVKFVDEDTVFESDLTDRKELIKKACNKLVELDIVSNDYCQSVLNREAISPTDNIYGFAIPHGDPKYVKKTRLTVVLLKEPIKWQRHLVSIVIFVNIAKEDLLSSKSILQDIFDLMQSKSFALALKSGMSKEEFMKFIGKD